MNRLVSAPAQRISDIDMEVLVICVGLTAWEVQWAPPAPQGPKGRKGQCQEVQLEVGARKEDF